MDTQKNWRRLLAAALLFGLAACGGGGGGGGGGGATPGTVTPVERNPLVPAAGALGAVLVENAADLRPLRVGARWEYNGFQTGAGGTLSPYTSSVRHLAGPANSVIEESSNVLFSGGTDSEDVTVAGGNAIVRMTDPLGMGTQESVDMVELRSPVRANDQYILLERNNLALGLDADGDGVADKADIVTYSTVVGTEPVQLAGSGRTVSAVRVDTTFVVRVSRSVDGTFAPLLRSVQSDWYARGVGVVRRTLTEPSETMGAVAFEEVLAYWDGVDQGVGATVAAALPLAAGVTPDAPYGNGKVRAAAVTGDTALLYLDPGSLGVPRIAVIDRQAQVTRLAPWPFPDLATFNLAPQLHGVGAASALLTMPAGGSSGFDVRMQRLDAHGDPQGTAATLPTGASLPPVTAWDGSALWVLWMQGPGGYANASVLLQPFALDGHALEPAQVLDVGLTISGGIHLAANGNGALLATWTRSDAGGTTYLYATRSAGSGQATVRTLATTPPVPLGYFTLEREVLPLVTANAALLRWRGPQFTVLASNDAMEAQERAVMLDAAGLPVRSAATLDGELLPRDWSTPGTNLLAAAAGERVVFAGTTAPALAQYAKQVEYLQVAPVSLASGAALATAAAGTTLIGSHAVVENGTLRLGELTQVLVWDKRVLLFGRTFAGNTVSTSWLP